VARHPKIRTLKTSGARVQPGVVATTPDRRELFRRMGVFEWAAL
jgi:hypothetical protein